MANYLITPCSPLLFAGDPIEPIVLNPIIVNDSGFTLNVGDINYFTFDSEIPGGCYSVDSISLDSPDTTISSTGGTYVNCLSCYQDNNWSYIVSACTDSGLYGPINSNFFNEYPINNFYSIEGPFWEGPLCFSVEGVQDIDIEVPFLVNGSYSDCGCTEQPRSANTETVICVVCSGETSTITPPHAVYTDAQGIAVTQLNTVVLGGPNGLNN